MRDSTTALLNRLNSPYGPADTITESEVFLRVQEQIKQMARREMKRVRRVDATADTTGLVDEVFLKVRKKSQIWDSSDQFFSYAQHAMKRMVIDAWRRASSEKRGGGLQRVELNENMAVEEPNRDAFPKLHEVLALLKDKHPCVYEVIWLFYFQGLKQTEVSRQMGISTATVTRKLRFGENFLFMKLQNDGSANRIQL